MVKHIFLLSIRNFFNNKIYSVTILLSLAIGFAISNVLIGFSLRELNTDSYHSKGERIFRLVSDDPFGRDGKVSYMDAHIPKYLSDNYPEIEATSMIYTLRNNGLSKENSLDKFHDLILLMIDSSFLEIFDISFSDGNETYAIGPNKIVFTRETSDVLFGKYPSLGNQIDITIDSMTIPLEVSGIIEKPFENSHLKFDGLVYYEDFNKERGGISYVLLNDGILPFQFESKINNDPSMPSRIGPGKINYYLQSLQQVYFDEFNTRQFSKARSKMFLWVSWAITFMVLFLAGFNFLILFFNAFLKRWKEFGMKKVLGATIKFFRLTAIFEVAFYVLVSFGLSILITYALLPWFNMMISSELSLSYFSNIRIILVTGILILVMAIFVVLKITRYLYRINPINLISNKSHFRIRINQYMLGFQFIISIILLICSFTIVRQTQFIKNKPLGFNRNILEVRAPRGLIGDKILVLQNIVDGIPGISSSSICSGNPISDNMILRYDLENDQYYTPYLYIGDENYLNTLGLTLIAGEQPSQENSNGKLVNEAFIKYFDLKEPLGEKIPGSENDYISGIVKDFNVSSLNQDIPPVIISISEDFQTLLTKIDLKQIGSILPEVEKYWASVYPSYPFKYLLMDDELLNKHKDDMVMSRIILASVFISILITCFGLFALSWGTTQERSKEISIRKVVGASSFTILRLLLNQFLKYIIIAIFIGVPISIYILNLWLEKFAFKVDISILSLTLAGVTLVIIAFLTVAYHTIKASIQNPVESLRYE